MPEVFTFTPTNDAEGDINYRTLEAQFGDGYSQSIGDGLNNREQSWPLTFTVERAQAQAIIAFIERHQGYRAFQWTPPLGVPQLWKVTGYKLSPLGGDLYRIKATFEQAYHP